MLPDEVSVVSVLSGSPVVWPLPYVTDVDDVCVLFVVFVVVVVVTVFDPSELVVVLFVVVLTGSVAVPFWTHWVEPPVVTYPMPAERQSSGELGLSGEASGSPMLGASLWTVQLFPVQFIATPAYELP